MESMRFVQSTRICVYLMVNTENNKRVKIYTFYPKSMKDIDIYYYSRLLPKLQTSKWKFCDRFMDSHKLVAVNSAQEST